MTDLPIYSYKNKLGGWNVVKTKEIRLPEKNGKIDFAFMDTFISAIKKLAIKEVVLYSDRKIAATKELVSKNNQLNQEMGFDSLEALAAACDAAHEKLSDIRTEMKSVEATIAEKKELRNHVLNYHKTRYVIYEMKACKNEKARQKYRDEHDGDFIILNAAKCYFDSKGLKKLPSHKALQSDVEQLIKEKNELYNQYQTAKEEAQRLDTIRHNIEQTLGRKIEHKQEQER